MKHNGHYIEIGDENVEPEPEPHHQKQSRWTFPASFYPLSIFRFFKLLTSQSKIPYSLRMLLFLEAAAQELPVTGVSYLISRKGLDLSPQQTTNYYALCFAPFSYQPLYAILTDHLPIFGFRRGPWLALCKMSVALLLLLLSMWADSFSRLLLIGMCIGVAQAFADVIIDALLVEIIHSNSGDDAIVGSIAGSVQAEAMTWKYIGSLCGSVLSMFVLLHWEARTVIAVSALVPLVSVVVVVFVPERPCQGIISTISTIRASPSSAAFSLRCQLCDFVKSWWKLRVVLAVPVLFLFVYNLVPSSSDMYGLYQWDALPFSTSFMNGLSMVGIMGSIFGSWGYWKFATHFDLRKLLVIVTLVGCAIQTFLQVTLATRANQSMFGVGLDTWRMLDAFASGMLSTFVVLPTLTLAARCCPKHYEASMFAIFMSARHVASLASAQITNAVSRPLQVSSTDFSNLWVLIVICHLAELARTQMLPWLPEDVAISTHLAEFNDRVLKRRALTKKESLSLGGIQ